ncbi:MAG: FtsX-like permease family protein [bacterium]
MTKFFKIAVRNVLRNKRRSIITGIAIGFGMLIMIFALSHAEGQHKAMIGAVVKNGIGHIQIHKKGYVSALDQYKDTLELAFDPSKIEGITAEEDHIKLITTRVNFIGLASNGYETAPVIGTGVEPDKEFQISSNISIIKGRKLSKKDDGGVIINKKVANALNLEVGDLITILVQTVDGGLNGSDLIVVGIFDLTSQFIRTPNLYMNLKSAQSLVYLEGKVSETIIVVDDYNNAELISQSLNSKLKNAEFEVHTWKYLGRNLLDIAAKMKMGMRVWTSLIMIVACIGILNTMIMAVFERIREIGVLMTMGARRSEIIRLFLIEAVVLGGIGSVIGSSLGILLVTILGHTGLPPMFEFLPSGELTYPVLKVSDTLISILVAIIISAISGIYPAVMASRLKPIESLRTT